jgi:ribokinase
MPGPRVVACGAVNWDVTLFVPSLPESGEEVTVAETARVPGGTGANVAVAAARLLGPEQVAFLGAVGDDDIGRDQRVILQREGVSTMGLRVVPGVESGQAYIFVDPQGANVIASALGANGSLTLDHLQEPEVQDLLHGADVYAVTDPPLEVVEALVALADKSSASLLWDPGIHTALGWNTIRDLAGRADVLLLNQIEAAQLLGESHAADVARKLLDAGWRNQVVLKRGAEGVILLDLAERRLRSVTALPLDALGLRPVSSVGAGDAFHGAFAVLRARGHEIAETLTRAVCAAGLKTTRPGTRDAPIWDELESAHARWVGLGIDLHDDPIP